MRRLKVNQAILADLVAARKMIRALIAVDDASTCVLDPEVKRRIEQTQYVQSWVLGPLDRAIRKIEGS